MSSPPEPGSHPRHLAEVLTEINLELVATPGVTQTLVVLAKYGVRLFRGAEAASVTRVQRHVFTTVGATSTLAAEVDAIQYKLGAGPGVDVFEVGTVVQQRLLRTGDLRSDDRWPDVGRRAAELTGVLSMLCVRLVVEGRPDLVTGLNFSSTRPYAFTAQDEVIAALLASVGALALSNATHGEKAVNLGLALHSNRRIGMALGIVMTRLLVTDKQAFDLLRNSSQSGQQKLSEVAEEIIDTGTLPLPAGSGFPVAHRVGAEVAP